MPCIRDTYTEDNDTEEDSEEDEEDDEETEENVRRLNSLRLVDNNTSLNQLRRGWLYLMKKEKNDLAKIVKY